ncbi:MAG TPA: alpha/beta fold hydrolase [Gemmatimonadales bacterium]
MVTSRVGLILAALTAPLAAQTPAPTARADTVPPASAVESPYVVAAPGIALAGTLTLPRSARGPVPVAVLIAGSGPTDRDGNSRLGIRTNTYAQLAWGLAARGIASLRYDKRGIGASRGTLTAADFARATLDQYAGDVKAIADTLRTDRRFSRVVLVGHSEGASLAVRAANLGAAPAGVVSLAGIGRPFLAVLRGQLARQLDSATLALYDTSMAAYLAGRDPNVPASLGALFAPVNREFMRSLAAFDPPAEIARVTCPVLIVQGDMDIQIAVEDADVLHHARASAREVILPGDNHVFKRVTGRDPAAQRAAYTDLTEPVDPAFVAAVADWILGLR